MKDKTLPDNEIIKALECCSSQPQELCCNCPIDIRKIKGGCITALTTYAIDLINRLQAEIEKLKEAIEYKDICIEACEEAKSEAVKECLVKVKNYIKTHCNPYGKPDFDYDTSIKILNFIDNLLKELVGENDAR